MANLGHRIGAGLLAGLFVLTTVGATVYVIWTINKQEPAVSQANSSNTTNDQANANSSQGKPLENFKPRTTPVSQLEKTDVTVGTGAEAKSDSTVTVNYTGALVADGKIFESSLDSGQPATLSLQEVIDGWKQGLPGMKVGGKRRIIMPYSMAYGEAGSPPTIPPKADLVFDIELLDVQ